jgi:hypothetical protein
MYWEEKIDLIKKQFPGDFKDPFRAGREVIQKIVAHLFNSRVSDFTQFDDKAALLKNRTFTKQCSVKQFYNEELPRLDNGSYYWLFFINVPAAGLRVYDCKYPALKELVSLSSGEYCIVDKKYAWALFIKIDSSKDLVEIVGNGIDNASESIK